MAWPNLGMAHRPVVMGTRGMVTSAHPLASAAGTQMLLRGGNAVDAAVATVAALNVVEPYMSGLGGCGYMLVYLASERRLLVLDYMGLSAGAATPSAFADQGALDHSPKSPLVPGACAGWLTALETYGTLDRATVFGPAIELAERGAPISLKNAYFYAHAHHTGHLTPEMQAIYLPAGNLPLPGSIVRQPQLAKTFRDLIVGGQDLFYRGELANRIVSSIQQQGGHLTNEDFADYRPEWQEAIRTHYRGFEIATPAPPCSGIQFLETFKMMESYDLKRSGQNSAETIHLLAEAMKLAIADRIAYVPDPLAMSEELLGAEYIESRRLLIDPNKAAASSGERFGQHFRGDVIQPGEIGRLLKECTTHLDCVDVEGNAVSLTQSLGDGFGSGMIAGETGIMINNLAFWFDLDPASPNVLAPRKKIEMCMSPVAVFKDERLAMVVGTPGSFGILQTTPQMISNVLDHGFSIQAAIEAPRFRTYEGTTIEIEARIPKATRDELVVRGHSIRLIDEWSYLVGGGQGILIDLESGVLMGGADPRRDGYAIGI